MCCAADMLLTVTLLPLLTLLLLFVNNRLPLPPLLLLTLLLPLLTSFLLLRHTLSNLVTHPRWCPPCMPRSTWRHTGCSWC